MSRTHSKHVDIIVCHYNKKEMSHIRLMVLHAMAFLCKERTKDLNVVFVDGSHVVDFELADSDL